MASKSRVINSGKNAFASIMNKMVIFVLTFVNRAFFVRYIGIEYLGIDGLFSNIINILSIADLGFGIAMSYTFYKPLADNDEKKLAALIGFYKKVYNIIAFAIAVVGCALIPFLKYLVNTDREIPYLKLIYLIVLINTVISYLWVYKSTIISADQKSYISTKYNTIVNFIKSIVQCVIIIILKNYIIYLLTGTIFSFIYNFYISYIADKLYPFIKQKVKLDKEDSKEIYKNMRAVFIYKICATLVGGIDNMIISVIVGTIMVGYYSNYSMLIYWITQFIVLVLNAITPSIGNVIVKESCEARYKVFSTIQMICFWLYSMVIVGYFNIADEFISLWLGKEFVIDFVVVIAISLDNYITGALRPLWTYRDATGLYQKTKHIMPFTALANLIFSVLLGKYFGLAGIIFATVLSRFVYFFYEPILLFKLYFERSSKIFFRDFFLNVILTSILCIIIKFIFSLMNLNIIASVVLKLIVSVFMVNIVYYMIYRKTEGYKYLISKIDLLCNSIKKINGV